MKKMNHCYVDIHVLQTVPPSCVNRDDTGSPKTAVYGGVTRARVSSQAWKHAVRLAFREMFSPDQLGSRTKKVLGKVVDAIILLNPDIVPEEAEKKAKDLLTVQIIRFLNSLRDFSAAIPEIAAIIQSLT